MNDDNLLGVDEMSRETTRHIQQEALVLLRGLAEQYGLAVLPEGGKFDTASATLKFRFCLPADAPGAEKNERTEFERYARMCGFNPNDYGKMFTYGGRQFTLVALKPGRPKFPVIGKTLDGRSRFKFQTHIVLASLAKGGR